MSEPAAQEVMELEAGSAESAGLWVRTKALVGQRMGYALADQVVYSFGNMVVAALVIRYCTKWEFGIYILTQRALDVLNQLCNVFLWGPYTFNLPVKAKGRPTLYKGSVLVWQLVACFYAAVLMWAIKGWASTPARGLYYGVFAPLVMTCAGIVFREYTRRMYFSDMRLKEAFWTDAATVALQIVGVWWLKWTGRLNVPNTLWMLSLGAIAVSLWWVVEEWRTFEIRWKDVSDDMRLNLRLGKWFLGSNMVFMVSSQYNPWLLSAMVGGVGVGMYSVCEQVVNIPRVALTSLQNLMAPMLARAFANEGKPGLKRMVARLDTLLLAGSVVFAAGVALLGPLAARLIFKKVPDNARVILIVLAVNLLAYAATMAQSYGLTAVDKANYTFYAQLAGLVAQAGISVWLVHTWQLPGAAAALLVSSVVVMVVRQVYYSREMRTA
jgi:O-antigen/teichoic acid export membrane protein